MNKQANKKAQELKEIVIDWSKSIYQHITEFRVDKFHLLAINLFWRIYLYLTNQSSEGVFNLQNRITSNVKEVAKDMDYIDDMKQEIEALCQSMKYTKKEIEEIGTLNREWTLEMSKLLLQLQPKN